MMSFLIGGDAYSQESQSVQAVAPEDFTSNPDDLVAGRFEIDEELIFSLHIKRYKLGDLIAVAKESGLLFDFVAYMEIVKFPIVENPQNRIYDGWFISRDNTFTLDVSDLSKPILSLNGIAQNVDPVQVAFIDDTLYISENYLKEWFGISHEHRYEALEILLTTSELLPFEQELRRRERSVRGSTDNKSIHPELFRGYEILSPQIFDFQLRSNYRQVTQDFTGSYGLLAARDVAQYHANLFLSGTGQDVLSTSRLNISKVSNEQNLLGFLGASKIEFGDVRPVRQGFSRTQSRGLRITNSKQTNELDVQVINIVGNLQIGWDVELYRNGALISQEFDVSTGQYEFLDVALLFGENNFEIIKYGPEGQIEKDTQTKTIDKSFLRNAGLVYSASLTQSGESVLDTKDETENFDAGYNLSTDIRTTVAPNVLLGIGLQSDFGGDIEQSQYNLTLNTIFADKYALFGGFNANTLGRQIARLGVRTSYGRHSFNASYENSRLNDFDPAHIFILTNSGSFPTFSNRRLTYNNEARYDQNVLTKRLNFSNSIGFTANSFGLFHRIEYVDEENLLALEDYKDIRGSLTLQKGFDNIFNRVTATYGIEGSSGLQAFNLATSWNMSKQFRLKFDLDYQLENENTIGSLLFGWRHNNFSLYARAGYSSLSEWDFGINTSFSLSAQPLIYGDTYFTERKIAQSGSLSVRVFIDENLNAKFDPNEFVVPNVKVNLLQSSGRGVTNEQGIATIVGIGDQTLSDVVINQDSLPDPYLRPLIEGVSIRFRKGIADKLDFPIAFASEVEGLLFIDTEKETRPLARVKVHIKNANGKIVKTSTSEYDGYFYFDSVFAGNYTLHVDKVYTDNKDLKAMEPITLTVKTQSELIIVDDIILAAKPKYDGYMALISTFPTEKSLQYYLQLNQKKLLLAQTKFVKLPNKEQVHFTAGFYANIESATAACKGLTTFNINCKASAYQYIAN